MIERGANVNIQLNHKWDNALHVATRYGHLAIVQNLIRAGSEINFEGWISEFGALQIAAFYGHLEIAKFLIEAGANIDLQTGFGKKLSILIILLLNR